MPESNFRLCLGAIHNILKVLISIQELWVGWGWNLKGKKIVRAQKDLKKIVLTQILAYAASWLP